LEKRTQITGYRDAVWCNILFVMRLNLTLGHPPSSLNYESDAPMTRNTENPARPRHTACLGGAASGGGRRTTSFGSQYAARSLEGYLRAWRPLTEPNRRSPEEAATRMMRARQSSVRLDDAALRELMTLGRA
jgi:hypothetical protein